MKDNIKNKETSQHWEKIFAKYKSDKGTVFKIHEKLLKLNNKKTTQFKNGQKI